MLTLVSVLTVVIYRAIVHDAGIASHTAVYRVHGQSHLMSRACLYK